MLHLDGHPVTAALFDMDGTMFDTERLRFETIRQATRELAQTDISDTVLTGSLGLSAVRAESLAKAHHGADFPYRKIRVRADDLELAHVRTHGVPIKPGLFPILERLRKNGLRLAVATSSRRAIALEYLINANVLRYFDAVICGDEVEHGKPHPEIFQTAAQAIGCAPETCLIVEDSENGLRAAIEADGLPVYIRDIRDPPGHITSQAIRRYAAMPDFLQELRSLTPSRPEPRLSDPFPVAQNQSIAGIHGFGAIGGGFLAQIFSHWDGYTRPRRIIGVTGDPLMRELVNAVGRYTVRYDGQAFDQVIRDVHLIDSADEAAVTDMYATSALIGLALPEHAIRAAAPLIARGLIARHHQSGKPLVILTILNKIGGGAFVRDSVRHALLTLAPGLADDILARTTFPEAMVNRIVSRVTHDSLARQARIKLRPLLNAPERPAAPEAPVFKEPWLEQARTKLLQTADQARQLEAINFVLFHSEPDMMVFAEKGDQHLSELCQLRVVDDIRQVQIIKNRLWNGPHAILAWYGDYLGHATIGQAMADERVAQLIENITEHEVIPVLAREMPTLARDLPGFRKTFLERCRGSFRDTCARVGRDPLRKLQRTERILGGIFAAIRQGRSAPGLETGVALALYYALNHPDEQECRIICTLYARQQRIEDVLTASGQIEGRKMLGLHPQDDADLIGRVARRFDALASQATITPHVGRA